MWDFVFGHSLMAMLIGGSLGAILWFFLMRRRLKTGFIGVLVITALCMVWGVFWLKMFAILEARIASVVNGRTYEPGNMSLFGAVFFDPVLFYSIAKAKKIEFRKAFDIFSIGLAIALILGRMNCFFAGCCVSGSFEYPLIGTVIWPVREIEVLYYIGFIALLAPMIVHNRTNGEVYPLFMASYGALRFVLEWTRDLYFPIGSLHLSHIWALISFVIGLVLYKRVTTNGVSTAVGRARKTGGTTR